MFLQSFRAVFVFVVYFKLRFFLLCFMNTSGRMYVNFVHMYGRRNLCHSWLCAMPCHAPGGIISNFQRLQRNRFRCVSCDKVLLFHHYMAYMLYSALCACCCCWCCFFFIFVFKHIITYIIMIYLVCFNCLAHLSPYLTVASITSAQTLDMSIEQ